MELIDRAKANKMRHTARWQRRKKYQLQLHPLCAYCLKQGKVAAAAVVDHVVPHRGDERLFWFGELQSLCWACHSGQKQQIEVCGYYRQIGIDGWPIDANHPVYR